MSLSKTCPICGSTDVTEIPSSYEERVTDCASKGNGIGEILFAPIMGIPKLGYKKWVCENGHEYHN